MEVKRNRITASRLITTLESSISSGVDESYNHVLQQIATIKHVKSLLDELTEPASDWASTSRMNDVKRGSVADLNSRLGILEKAVLHRYATLKRQANAANATKPAPEIEYIVPSLPSPPTLSALVTESPADTIDLLLPVTGSSALPVIDTTNEYQHDPARRASSGHHTPPTSISISPASPEPSVLRSRNTAFPSKPTFNFDEDESGPPVPPKSVDSVLQHHHDLQSSLTTSLSTMATQLKLNSLQFSEALSKDKAVMEDAQEKLSGNLGVMKKEGGRLEGYKRKAGGTTCFVLMGTGGVAIMWVGIFLLVKVT